MSGHDLAAQTQGTPEQLPADTCSSPGWSSSCDPAQHTVQKNLREEVMVLPPEDFVLFDQPCDFLFPHLCNARSAVDAIRKRIRSIHL